MERSDINMRKSLLFHLLIICVIFLGILIFLYGFFPIKYVSRKISSLNDLPDHVFDVRVNTKQLYFPRINQLVFIVIDALRWDFLIKPENKVYIPYIRKLLNTDQACLLYAECSHPTVTMPRLKALMTGSVPNFIDVVLNLGSSQIKEDSLIIQAVENKKKVVFYGDDTWLKMFPSAFLRSEGTTSFFISDYEDVDSNVTRHIPRELAVLDWDIMVLHYLGLDHIGHLVGPFSPLVGPKLQEMDQVVEMVVEGLKKRRENGSSPMVVIVGDHGMRNSGGHGGSTPDEILTSLLFVQPSCSKSKWFKEHVWQTDVTPTLATLLGLPIPHNSIGTLIPAVLATLPPLHHLYALHYNAQHLRELAISTHCLDKESTGYFVDAEKTFAHVLKSNSKDKKLYERGVWLYERGSYEMSQCLARLDAGFHVVEMVAGCSIFFVIIITAVINVLVGIEEFATSKSVLAVTVATAILAAYFFKSLVSILVAVFTVTVTAYLSSLWLSPQTLVISLITRSRKCTFSTAFLLTGTSLHALTLFGSSLVEEEHQTCYFLWTTLNLIKLYTLSAQMYCHTKEKKLRKATFQVIFLLVVHRFLRTLNQTGDKWAHLPDTGDWLRHSENWFYHLLFSISGLVGVWISLLSLNRPSDIFCNCAYATALVLVLLCRSATGQVELPFSYAKSKGVTEGNFFWLLVILASLRQIWKGGHFLNTFTSFLILTLALLLRPHNVVILPFLTFASRILFSVYPSVLECTMAHFWMGSAAFFYQGNSNSLTSIDVTAGYVGSADHDMFRVGLLVFLHTFATPILSFLLLFIGIIQGRHERQSVQISLQLFTLQKILPLFVACLICVLHRHHLFVWSVFAPKLLYEVTSSVVILFLSTLFSVKLLCSVSGTKETK